MNGADSTTTVAEREAWLASCVDALRPVFALRGYDVPANIRVSVGFPHGARGRGMAIGQCWADSASDGSVFEIFISPVLSGRRSLDVGATLAHEIAHATVGLAHGHDKVFGRCVRAIGLTGKNTATVAGSGFDLEWNGGLGIAGYDEVGLGERLGAYPHERLRPMMTIPKAKTRLLKVECPECLLDEEPYIVRMSAATIERAGTPVCPIHGCAMVRDGEGE